MSTSTASDRPDLIRDGIRESSRPSQTFWLMNGLATVIACYGLLSNSAAVVISPCPANIGSGRRERAHARLADAGVPLMSLFSIPNSVKGITPLVGQILLECETPWRRRVTELHLFYDRPTSLACAETLSSENASRLAAMQRAEALSVEQK